MALSKAAVSNRVAVFNQDLDRAFELYARIVEAGFTAGLTANPSPLRHPDRRDAAQFIFFEASAKFEAFIQDLFVIEVRKTLADSPKRSQYIMGNSDRGLSGVLGWASPPTVRQRARNLFGNRGFFAHLDTIIGPTTYQRLQLAHTLRNRVAHDTRDVAIKYRKALAQLQTPQNARRGTSVGRALVDYPATASRDDRWFHRLLEAYRRLGKRADTHL